MKTLEEGTLKPSVLRRWGSESCHGFLVPLRAEGSGSVPSRKISSYHRDVKENYSAIPFTDKNDIKRAKIAYVSTIAGNNIAFANCSGLFATIPILAADVFP